MKKILLFLSFLPFLFGCAATGESVKPQNLFSQFKAFDEKLNAAIREDAQNEIKKCQTYNISDIDKKQCALCGEYVISVIDWKDSKKDEFKRLLDLSQISPELGDKNINILSFAADIAYGDAIVDPREQLKKLEDEAAEKAINLKNACAPLFTKVKIDLAKLGIGVGENFIQLPR